MEFQTKGRERGRGRGGAGETGSSLAFHAFRAGFAAVVVLFCRSVVQSVRLHFSGSAEYPIKRPRASVVARIGWH